VQRLDVRTVIHLPPGETFEFLLDFPGYADYSEYLTGVHADGDGGPGTIYQLRFAWWKLTYTAVSKVTAVERPERIDWEVIEDIDAHGAWLVEPLPDHDAEHATEVTFRVVYDRGSIDASIVDLPRLVSFEWVIDRVVDLIIEEARRVVERIVADIEGQQRPVTLDVERTTVEEQQQ
jgi:uncharacterized membrane protein